MPLFFSTMWQADLRPASCPLFICWLACGLRALGPRCKPGKNISPFYVCFSDQGSSGRQAGRQAGGHTDSTERGSVAARLARGQGVCISFQAWTNYWFKLWSPALSSLILKSVTPSRKTIRGLRGLAKGASRKWSLVVGIVRRMRWETGIVPYIQSISLARSIIFIFRFLSVSILFGNLVLCCIPIRSRLAGYNSKVTVNGCTVSV